MSSSEVLIAENWEQSKSAAILKLQQVNEIS